jgi:hypothetical protein
MVTTGDVEMIVEDPSTSARCVVESRAPYVHRFLVGSGHPEVEVIRDP